MSDHETSRLTTELELLEAMYPNQTSYDTRAGDLKFISYGHASLLLRLPETYPDHGLPDIISATDAAKNDVRTETKVAVQDLALVEGEEALDAIIAAFQQVLEDAGSTSNPTILAHEASDDFALIPDDPLSPKPKTVIIWLHHLLNTNKRKLALSPTNLSGLTKPGYPGVLVYSGPSQLVTEHVAILKAQNWQAFSVRYEEEEEWLFAHGDGVREVETMAEVAKGVQVEDQGKASERGRKQKDTFLKAVGIR